MRMLPAGESEISDQWRSRSSPTPTQPSAKASQAITTTDMLDILRPIWREKTETASRVRGRVENSGLRGSTWISNR